MSRWIAGDILGWVAVQQGRAKLDALAEALGLSRKRVSESAAGLVKLGFLERLEPGEYQLTEAGAVVLAEGTLRLKSGPKGPMPRKTPVGLRKKAWAAMRTRPKFTVGDLLELVADGSEKDAPNNLSQYVAALEKAGFVVKLPRKKAGEALTSNGFNVYLLVRNTGSKAPVWRVKDGAVYDPNTGCLHLLAVWEAA